VGLEDDIGTPTITCPLYCEDPGSIPGTDAHLNLRRTSQKSGCSDMVVCPNMVQSHMRDSNSDFFRSVEVPSRPDCKTAQYLS